MYEEKNYVGRISLGTLMLIDTKDSILPNQWLKVPGYVWNELNVLLSSSVYIAK